MWKERKTTTERKHGCERDPLKKQKSKKQERGEAGWSFLGAVWDGPLNQQAERGGHQKRHRKGGHRIKDEKQKRPTDEEKFSIKTEGGRHQEWGVKRGRGINPADCRMELSQIKSERENSKRRLR